MRDKLKVMPMTEVLDWLREHYPKLHEAAEIDRAWVWLVADLRGCGARKGCECPTCVGNRKIREDLKSIGFVFSHKGGHPLPSGKIGTWGHHCTQPIPFKRKGGAGGVRRRKAGERGGDQPVQNDHHDELDREILEMLAQL